MPLTGDTDAPGAPRRYTTMEPAVKPVGAGKYVDDTDADGVDDGVTDADGVVVRLGVDAIDGVTGGVTDGVGANGANAMPRKIVLAGAVATYVKHAVHVAKAVPTAWLSS